MGLTQDHKLDWAFLRPQEPVKFTEGTGKVMNTVPPERLELARGASTTSSRRSPWARSTRKSSGVAGGNRHREGQTLRSRRADEEDPDQGPRAAIGNAAARTLNFRWRPCNSVLLTSQDWAPVQPAVSRRLQHGDAAAAGQRGRRHHPLSAHGRAHAERTDRDVLLRHLYDTGDDHAADGYRLAVFHPDFSIPRANILSAKTYKVTLRPNIPAGKFWSFTVYDNQTRSMLDTPQRYPRARRPGAVRRPPQAPVPTARRPCISARPSPTA